MKVLVMNFLTANGKKTSLRISNVKDGLDGSAIAAVMDKVIQKNIFAPKDGEMRTKESASIATTVTEDIDLV